MVSDKGNTTLGAIYIFFFTFYVGHYSRRCLKSKFTAPMNEQGDNISDACC